MIICVLQISFLLLFLSMCVILFHVACVAQIYSTTISATTSLWSVKKCVFTGQFLVKIVNTAIEHCWSSKTREWTTKKDRGI